MTAHPILFTDPMVRAILDGRKTVTRRPVRSTKHSQDADAWCWDASNVAWESGIAADYGRHGHGEWVKCPYGVPGDTLWVRETWRVASSGRHYPSRTTTVLVEYRERSVNKPRSGGAQSQTRFVCSDRESDSLLRTAYGSSKDSSWRPSIHMPRWASRIILEVTNVRVERLQEITEEQAMAEGFGSADEFDDTWDAVYGKGPYSWAQNPWVWAVSFQRSTP